ncbi:MAG: CBS domain-containing protein [Chloroflexota bacterium]
MFIKDIMTKKVITAPSDTPIGEAQKILRDGCFRRLPVVDDGKLVGVVTEGRLEKAALSSTAPLLWQIGQLIAHTTLRDVMAKKVITISPDATVEEGAALAQKSGVGSLVVVEDRDKVVGIVTTNDFFYRLLNPVLGIGEPGIRIFISGAGDGKTAEKVLSTINQLGIEIKVIWTLRSTKGNKKDIIVHLNTSDPAPVLKALEKLGCRANVRAH